MSWAQDEWKNNLPHAALVKIENYEKTLDHLKKEQQQKNIKVDILEGTLAQQKKTVDEQKFKLGNLQKENHTLTEKWRDSEISKEKILHDLQTKDARISCLDGQVNRLRQQYDNEVQRLGKLEADYQREVGEKNRVAQQLQRKEEDIAKLQRRLKSSGSGSESNNHGSSQAATDILISFDDSSAFLDTKHEAPKSQNFLDNSVHDLLGLGSVTKQRKTSSSSSQNSTFGIFGDIMDMNQDHGNKNSQKSSFNIFGDFDTPKVPEPVMDMGGNSVGGAGDGVLREKINQAQTEIKKLMGQLEATQAELTKSSNSVKQLVAQVESDDNIKKQMTSKFKELHQKYEEAERMVHTKCAEIKQLDENLQNQERSKRELGNKLQSQENLTMDWERKYADQSSKYDQSQQTVNEKTKECQQMDKELQSKEKLGKELERKLFDLNSKFEQSQQSLQEKTHESQRLSKELQLQENKSKEFERKLLDLTDKFDQTQKSLNEKLKECQQLDRELQTKDRSLKELDQKLFNLNCKYEQSQQTLQEKTNEVQRLSKDLQTQENKTKEFERKSLDMTQKYEQSQKVLSEKNLQIENMNRDIQNNEKERKELEKHTNELKNKFEQLQYQHNEKSSEFQQLEKKFNNQEKEKKDLEKQSNDMKTQLDQLQKQIKEKSIEFEQVEKKLQNQVREKEGAENKIQQLTDKFDEQSKEMEKLCQESKQLQETIESLQQAKKRSEDSITCMTGENEMLLKEKNDLAFQLEQVREFREKYEFLNSKLEAATSALTSNEEEYAAFKETASKSAEESCEKITELQKFLEETSKSNEELEKKISSMADTVDNCESDKNALRQIQENISNELNKVTSKYENMVMEFNLINQQNAEYKERLEESVELMRSKEVDVKNIAGELENANEDLQMKTKHFEDLSTTHNNAVNQLNVVEDRLQTSEHQLAENVSLLAEKEHKVTQLCGDLSNIQDMTCKQLEKLEKELESLQVRINQSDANLRKVDSLLASKIDLCNEQQVKINHLTSVVEVNEKELDQKQKIIEESSRLLAEANRDIKVLTKLKIDLEKDNAFMKSELEILTTALKKTEEHLSSILGKAVKWESQVSQLNSDLENLTILKMEQEENYTKQISQLEVTHSQEKNTLESGLEEEKGKVVVLRKALNEISSQCDQLTAQIGQLNQDHADALYTLNEKLTKDFEVAREDLMEEKCNEVNAIQENYDQIQDKFTQLSSKYEDMLTSFQQASDEHRAALEEKQQMINKKIALIESYDLEKIDFGKKFEGKEHELEFMKERYQLISSECEELSSKIVEINNMHEQTLQQTKVDLNSDFFKEKNVLIVTHLAEKEEITMKLADKENEMTSVLDVNSKITKNCKELKDKHKQVTSQLDKTTRSLALLKNEKASIVEENEKEKISLQSMISKKEEDLTAMKCKLTDLEGEKSHLLASLNESLLKHEVVLNEKVEELSSLKTNFDELEENYNKSKRNLNSALQEGLSLNEQLAIAQTENEVYCNTKRELEGKMVEKEHEIAVLTEEKKEMSLTVENLTASNIEFISLNELMKVSLDEKALTLEEKIKQEAEYVKEVEELKGHVQAIISNHEESKQSLEKEKSDLALKMENDNSAHQEMMNERSQKIVELEKYCESISSEKNEIVVKMEEMVSTHHSSMESLKVMLASEFEEQKNIIVQVNTVEKEKIEIMLRQKENELLNYNDEKKGLLEVREKLVFDNSEMKCQLDKMAAEHDGLKMSFEKEKSEMVANSEAEKMMNQQLLDEKIHETLVLTGKHDELVVETVELHAQIEQLSSQHEASLESLRETLAAGFDAEKKSLVKANVEERENMSVLLAEKETEINCLNKERIEMKADILFFQSGLDAADAEREKLKNALEKESDELIAKNEEYSSIEESLNEKLIEISTLTEEKDQLSTEVSEIKSQLDALTSDYDEMTSKCNELSTQISELNTKHEASLESLKVSLTAEFEVEKKSLSTSLEGEKDMLTSELSGIKSKLNEVIAEHEEIRNVLEEEKSDLLAKNEEYALQQDCLNEKIKEISTLTEKHDDVVSRNNELIAQIDQLNSEHEISLESQKEKLTTEFETEKTALTEEKCQLESELSEIKSLLDKAIAEHDETRSTLEEEKKLISMKCEDMSTDLSDIKKHLENVHASFGKEKSALIAKNEKAVEKLQENLDAKSLEIANLTTAKDGIFAKNNDLISDMDVLKSEHVKEITQMKATLEEKSKDLDLLDEKIEELLLKDYELDDIKVLHDQALVDLQKERDSFIAYKVEIDHTSVEMAEKLNAASTENGELNSVIEKLKTDHEHATLLLSEAKSSLENELEAMQSKHADEVSSNAELIEEKQKEVDLLSSEVTDKTAEVMQYSEKLSAASIENEELDSVIVKLRTEHEHATLLLSEAKSSLEKELEAMQSKHADEVSSNAELIEEKQKEVDLLSSEVTDKTAEVKQYSEKLSAASIENEELDSVIVKLRTEHEHATLLLSEAKSSLEKELEAMQSKHADEVSSNAELIEEKQKEVDLLSSEVTDKTAEVKQYSEKLSAASIENEELDSVIVKLRTEHEHATLLLSEAKSSLEKELEAMQSKHASEVSSNAELIEEKQKEVDLLSSEVTDKTAEVKQYSENLNAASTENEELNSVIVKLRTEHEHATLLLSEAKSSLEKELEAMQSKHASEVSGNAELIEEKQKEVDLLSSQVTDKTVEVKQYSEELLTEKENSRSLQSEVEKLNVEIQKINTELEASKKKVKRAKHDSEKKDISIEELEKELKSHQSMFDEKKKEAEKLNEEIVLANKMLKISEEKCAAKQGKLNQIKQSLLRTRNPDAVSDDIDSLSDCEDMNSQILKLQEQISLSEFDNKKKFESALEEERTKIVEKSKEFVMEREQENEQRNKNLNHQIEMKERKISNLEKKLQRKDDDIKQLEYEVGQTKLSYENIIAQHEHDSREQQTRSKKKTTSETVKDMELNLKLETVKQKYDNLEKDFKKTIDSHEKMMSKSKKEVEKVYADYKDLEDEYNKKENELKELQALSKGAINNEIVLGSLKEKLQKSDAKNIEMELKHSDYQSDMKKCQANYNQEIMSLNSKIAALSEEKLVVMKQLDEARMLLKNASLTIEAPKSAITPLAKSLSNLNVVNSDEDGDDENSVKNDRSKSSNKRDGEKDSDKTAQKKICLDPVLEESEEEEKTRTARKASMRRSTRRAPKPTIQEKPSSSDEEVLQKQIKESENSHPSKENDMDDVVVEKKKTRNLNSNSKDENVLAPRKTRNANSLSKDENEEATQKKKTRSTSSLKLRDENEDAKKTTMTSKSNSLKENETIESLQTKRATRSTRAATSRSMRSTRSAGDLKQTQSKAVNVEIEDEKCNMQ